MKENKLTPEEIKSALLCCDFPTDELCCKCCFKGEENCTGKLTQATIDLINRQQAEIEEWKKINQQLANEMEKRRKEDIGIAKGYARIMIERYGHCDGLE